MRLGIENLTSLMLSLLLASGLCGKFAVLFAGSNEWYNYRHQADIFTIYGQLIDRKIPEKNIFLMCYDDLAQSSENPFKGQIFHTTTHDKNVYPGSDKINYKGDQTTAANLYDVLTDKLQSTSSDYLFIFYDNHGGSGILGAPAGPYIYADDLANALTKSQSNGKYKQCLFLIEACYAGSVAEKFTAPDLVTITASNNHESSYADVYDDTIGGYLTNEFTNHFIALIDENPTQTVDELYEALKKQTVQSHVMFYGDAKMKPITLDTFIGTPNNKVARKNNKHYKAVSPSTATLTQLLSLQQNESPAIRARARLTLHSLQTLTKKFDIAMEEIVRAVAGKSSDKLFNGPCGPATASYLKVLRHFNAKFGKMNHDDMVKFAILNNLCASYPADKVIAAIDAVL